MLLQTIKVLGIFGVIVFGLIYFFQRHLIYFPDRHRPKLDTHEMNVITIKTSDNIQLNAWYKAAADNQPTVLYLHGNAGNISNRMPIARQFIAAKFGLLLLDYRSYGGNAGKATEQGFYEDGRAAVRFLKQQDVSLEKLVLYGESLGTGVATKLAAENASCALILQSPFTSLSALGRFHYPWLFLEPWDKYDSLARINSIHTPLLILHGTSDQVVPYSEALTLFNAALQPKKMLSFTGYDHHNLWQDADFYPQVIHFIHQHCS